MKTPILLLSLLFLSGCMPVPKLLFRKGDYVEILLDHRRAEILMVDGDPFLYDGRPYCVRYSTVDGYKSIWLRDTEVGPITP